MLVVVIKIYLEFLLDLYVIINFTAQNKLAVIQPMPVATAMTLSPDLLKNIADNTTRIVICIIEPISVICTLPIPL